MGFNLFDDLPQLHLTEAHLFIGLAGMCQMTGTLSWTSTLPLSRCHFAALLALSLSLSPLLPLASHIYSSSKAHMTSWGQVFALGKVTFSKHSSRTIA